MAQKPPFDWFAFSVRFFFGALLGLFLGFILWVRAADGGADGWIVVGGSVVLLGVAAGYWGDSFWHALKYWLWWS
jgi:hypothetical protein